VKEGGRMREGGERERERGGGGTSCSCLRPALPRTCACMRACVRVCVCVNV